MLKYAKIKDKPKIFRSFTGLTMPAFRQLLNAFERAEEQAWHQQQAQRDQPRQRRRGGGRKAALATVEDKLVFILFYFKFYPTQEVLGFLFGLGQPQANEWIHRLTPLLNAALGYEQQLPARQAADLQQLLAQCPELEFIIDGTERPIQRPTQPQHQRDYYSGKKKRHTVKNIAVTEKRTKKVKGLGQTQAGKKHDKAATDEEGYRFPKGSQLWQDTGFQGYAPDQTTIYQPKKKPRGGQLTEAEKQHNQTISRQRIGVEHSLAGVKVFRIVRDVYRNHKHKFINIAPLGLTKG